MMGLGRFGKIGSIVDYRGEVYLTFTPFLNVPCAFPVIFPLNGTVVNFL